MMRAIAGASDPGSGLGMHSFKEANRSAEMSSSMFAAASAAVQRSVRPASSRRIAIRFPCMMNEMSNRTPQLG
ncbi:MAG: hypothetical protein ACR2JF_04210, partial [Iamia sp.]